MQYGNAVIIACVVLAIAVEVHERVTLWRKARRKKLEQDIKRAANAWAERCEQ